MHTFTFQTNSKNQNSAQLTFIIIKWNQIQVLKSQDAIKKIVPQKLLSPFTQSKCWIIKDRT